MDLDFSKPIHTILAQVSPSQQIDDEVVFLFNKIIIRLGMTLSDIAFTLMEEPYTKNSYRKTCNSREIQTSVRLFLPGELAKHAVSEGTKAVTKYTSTDKKSLNLSIPLSKVRQILDLHHSRKSEVAIVYLSAVLEYILAELIEISSNATNGTETIELIHVKQAVSEDSEILAMIKKLKTMLPGFLIG